MEIPWKEQCKYCQKSFNTTYCSKYEKIINNSKDIWYCPYFVYDRYIFGDKFNID